MSTNALPDALPPANSNPAASTASVAPFDTYLSIVNNLLLFYQNERIWVQRTRGSLELALVRGPLLVIPTAVAQPEFQSDSDGSAPSVVSSEGTANTNESTPATTDSDMQSSIYSNDGRDPSAKRDSTSVKYEQAEDDKVPDDKPVLAPLTLRASSRKASSRWLKRKQSYNLRLGTLANHAPRPRRLAASQGLEPSAQLLEQFADLLDARMESCIRVARLLREYNRATLYTW